MTDLSETNPNAPRMLIADDDPGVLRIIADQCRKMGFKVETVANGIQALIKARRSRPDILIIDVNMPGVDGFSVGQRLLMPDKAAMEMIVITGSKSADAGVWCDSVGAHFVHKGSNFWSKFFPLLAAIFPGMSDKIKEQEMQFLGGEVWTRPRVLVVDDDPDIHTFLSSRLGKFGVDTLYASDSVQGFRIACRSEPSVILCDYYIPNGDVLYMLMRLRSTPLTENIPVFVMSAKKLDDPTQQVLKREVCGRPGVERIFQKSSNTSELFEAVRGICAFETKGSTLDMATF